MARHVSIPQAASRLLVVLVASSTVSAQPPPSGPPSMQPVRAESLGAETLAAFRAPLVAEVRAESLVPNPTPKISFVSGLSHFHNLNAINHNHGGFEPMAFRPKLRAQGTDPARVVLDGAHCRSLAEGFYDGARVRVYQPIDGKLVKIRDTKVKPGGHHASGWLEARGQLTTGKDKTSFRMALDSSFLPDRDYWFCVRAVDDFQQRSEPSNVVTARSGEAKGQESPDPLPPFQQFQSPGPGPLQPPPAAPQNLRVAQEGDTLTFTWDPVATDRLRGYQIFVSAVAPEKHKGFGLELESREPRPDRPIQKDDIVFIDQFKTTLTRDDVSAYVNWPALRKVRSPFADNFIQEPFKLWSDGADGYPAKWELTPHPQPVPPEFSGGGQTCLRWSSDSDAATGFPITPYGGSKDTWYPALTPGEYQVEAWVRGSGRAELVFVGRPFASRDTTLPYNQQAQGADQAFSIPPVELPLTDTWRKVTGTFSVPDLPEQAHGSLLFAFQGPGEVYLDNLQIFRKGEPYGVLPPATLEHIRESDMRFMRTHELIKTDWGYGLDGMTGYAGGNNYSAGNSHTQTFFSLLDNMRRAGNISPWLQVEMCLSEDEWLGFAEWLCAPYDPAAGDTPEKKPWAFKRWSMGQKKPWIEEFPELAFEISNETWNETFAPYDWDWGRTITDGATGSKYSYGATHGLFNEYVIGLLRSSPYWTPQVEAKTKFMLCGWTAAPGFGAEAARLSPSADAVTYAAYVHNQGLGDPKEISDFKRFHLMQWPLSGVEPQAAKMRDAGRRLHSEGVDIESGIYEYGYAYYVMPGDPAAAKEVDQQLARSMIGAVAILDATLTNFRFGLQDQAFFTFGPQIGPWGSHTTSSYGGHAYPFWKALTLFNQHGVGYPLQTKIESVPRWSFPAYKTEDNMHEVTRPALPDAPLVSVHAFAEGNRCTVFLISRKLDGFPIEGDDGFTPAKVRLPFSKAAKITLHQLAGDPRTDDRFAENVRLKSQEINPTAFRGTLEVGPPADPRGLPPASILCYVFEGTDLSPIARPPAAGFKLPPGIVANEPAEFASTADPTLAHAWDLGESGTFTEPKVKAVFPEAGLQKISLKVTAPNGLSDTLEQTRLPVGIRWAGETWQPWSLEESKGRGPVARGETDGRLTMHGTGAATAQGRFSLLHAKPQFGTDFTFEATVEGIEGAGLDPRVAGGLALVVNPRGGLGFGYDDYEQLTTPASLFVSPDGAVRRLRGQGEQIEELLPAGSLTFPARLRIVTKGASATASVEAGGKWKDVATFALPEGIGLMPALVAASNGPNNETTLTLQQARITRP